MVGLINVHRCGGPVFKAAVAETQGKRPSQEDVHAMQCVGKSADFWVLDGHRGAGAAQYGAKALARELGSVVHRSGGKFPTCEQVQSTFESVDSQLRRHAQKDCSKAGSTVIGALATQQKDGTYSLMLLNCGDSRGVVVRGPSESKNSKAPTVRLPKHLDAYMQEDDWAEDASWLPEWPAVVESIDHKPTFPLERARIEAAGGRVSGGTKARVDGCLAVSRGLGDFCFKNDPCRSMSEQKVSCIPDVYHVSGLQPGAVMILACDGLWDMITTERAATFVRKKLQRQNADLGEIAADLMRSSIRKGSGDNITVMLVQLTDGSSWVDMEPEEVMPVRPRSRQNQQKQ